MKRLMDQVVMESGRAWWDGVSRHDSDPLALDGYGQAAAAGGEALLRAIGDDVRDKLEVSRDARVLEVGCGAGAITRTIAPGAGGTIGVDFSHGMLLQARRLGIPGTEFLMAEAARLPFEPRCFDRVLCYSVFNNFPSLAYAQAVVHELIRVVKRGGVVLIGQVPNDERKAEWHRIYAARFGGAQRSRLRWWAGGVKQRAVLVARLLRAACGGRATPSLHFQYYKPAFFRELVQGAGHACEILPALNLIQDGGPAHHDYRIDVRIRT